MKQKNSWKICKKLKNAEHKNKKLEKFKKTPARV